MERELTYTHHVRTNTHISTQHKFNIKLRKYKQRQTNEQRDNILLCFGSENSEACLLVFADVAGWSLQCLCLCFIAGTRQSGQMQRSLRNSLLTHLKASRSGAEGSRGLQDRTEAHFYFYNVILPSFCFSFSVCLLSLSLSHFVFWGLSHFCGHSWISYEQHARNYNTALYVQQNKQNVCICWHCFG